MREGCGPDDARLFARLSGETYCFVVSVERPLTVMVSVRSIDAGRAPLPTENVWISGASKVLSLVISTLSNSLFRSTGPI